MQDRHALWPKLTPPHLLDSKGYLITKAIPTIPPDLAAELEATRPHDIPERPGIVFDPSDNLLSDVVRKGMNGLLARLLEVGMAESADAKLNALVEAVRASNIEAIMYCHASSGDYSSASPPDRCISTVLSAPRPTQPTPTCGYHDGHSSPFWSVGNTGKDVYHTRHYRTANPD